MNDPVQNKTIIRIALAGAALTMAFQVAGKAARDGLFLSNFLSRQLPFVVMAGAVCSILLGLGSSRLFSRFAPGRLVPLLMIFSGILQTAEWALYQHYPQWTAVAVYIHVVALGAVITSGFWSVINEQMDPYTAKQNFGRVAAAGTLGGVLGGGLAERIAVMVSSEAVLLAMAVLQILTGVLLAVLPATASTFPETRVRARDVLRGSSYLKSLSVLVVIGTFSAALIDLVLKVEARRTIGPGEPLMRFFAAFHTGTAVLAFLVQTTATPMFLNRWGLGFTISTLPASVAGGGMLALVTSGFPIVVLARALEAVVRSSLYRAGYELFYTPMLASEKRAVKSINDVTLDRLGDGLGGGFAQLVLSTAGRSADPILLATAAGASGAGLFVARHLNKAYLRSLERSLEHHAAELADSDDDEPVTPPPSRTVGPATDIGVVAANVAVIPEWLPAPSSEQWCALLSPDVERVKEALTAGPELHRALLPLVIPMLTRKRVGNSARRALEAVADRNVGQLSDWLLDKTTPIGVRCALPAIIAYAGGDRAADALLRALCDDRLEVRYQCANALDTMRRNSDVTLEPERVYGIVRGEIKQGRLQVERRSNAELQHLIALLGLVLPPDPVKIAFEGLGAEDQHLRGLSLEYLESALPPDIGDALLSALRGERSQTRTRRSLDDIKQELTDFVGRLDAGLQGDLRPSEPKDTAENRS